MDKKPDSDHWLVRSGTIRMLWIMAFVVLALLIIADIFAKHYSYFGIEGTFAFAAWFGFVSCAILVVASKVIGAIFKRPDNYYDQ